MMTPRFALILPLVFMPFLLDSRGDEPGSAAPETTREETPVVLRVSKQLFEELTRDVIEMSIPIDRNVDKLRVTGTATGKGWTTIHMGESDVHAELVISVAGQALGRMQSDVGPANAYMTTRAKFTTRKRIRFDGELFRDDPASTDNRNCTSVDRICAKRRGLVGCVVEKVGRRIASKAVPELNAEAESVTGEVLTNKFNEAAVDLLATLNQTTELEELVHKYFPETQSWATRSVTRPTFLVAGMGPVSTSLPEFLIARDREPKALIELWLRTTPGQAALLQMIADMDGAYDVLQDRMPEDESDQLLGDVKLARENGWSVIQMGLPETPSENAGEDKTSS